MASMDRGKHGGALVTGHRCRCGHSPLKHERLYFQSAAKVRGHCRVRGCSCYEYSFASMTGVRRNPPGIYRDYAERVREAKAKGR